MFSVDLPTTPKGEQRVSREVLEQLKNRGLIDNALQSKHSSYMKKLETIVTLYFFIQIKLLRSQIKYFLTVFFWHNKLWS